MEGAYHHRVVESGTAAGAAAATSREPANPNADQAQKVGDRAGLFML
jgi:hypothetical protein